MATGVTPFGRWYRTHLSVHSKPSLQRYEKELARKPAKTPKRCPGGQPAPQVNNTGRQRSCSREGRHNNTHPASFLRKEACCSAGENHFAISALSKRATCSPFPMALCVRTNRPHAEICRIEGFFSTQPRSTFKPTHGKTPTSTTLRCCHTPNSTAISNRRLRGDSGERIGEQV